MSSLHLFQKFKNKFCNRIRSHLIAKHPTHFCSLKSCKIEYFSEICTSLMFYLLIWYKLLKKYRGLAVIWVRIKLNDVICNPFLASEIRINSKNYLSYLLVSFLVMFSPVYEDVFQFQMSVSFVLH